MKADVPLDTTLADPLTVGTFLTAFLGDDATTQLVPAEEVIAGVMNINVRVFEMKWGDDNRLKKVDVAFDIPSGAFTVADFGTVLVWYTGLVYLFGTGLVLGWYWVVLQ